MSHPGLSLLFFAVLMLYLVVLLARRSWGGGWWRGGPRRRPDPDLPGEAKKLTDDVFEKAARRVEARAKQGASGEE